MRDDRANHDDGKQTGRIERVAWNQQTDGALQGAGRPTIDRDTDRARREPQGVESPAAPALGTAGDLTKAVMDRLKIDR
jgi:hypothetical protein